MNKQLKLFKLLKVFLCNILVSTSMDVTKEAEYLGEEELKDLFAELLSRKNKDRAELEISTLNRRIFLACDSFTISIIKAYYELTIFYKKVKADYLKRSSKDPILTCYDASFKELREVMEEVTARLKDKDKHEHYLLQILNMRITTKNGKDIWPFFNPNIVPGFHNNIAEKNTQEYMMIFALVDIIIKMMQLVYQASKDTQKKEQMEKNATDEGEARYELSQIFDIYINAITHLSTSHKTIIQMCKNADLQSSGIYGLTMRNIHYISFMHEFLKFVQGVIKNGVEVVKEKKIGAKNNYVNDSEYVVVGHVMNPTKQDPLKKDMRFCLEIRTKIYTLQKKEDALQKIKKAICELREIAQRVIDDYTKYILDKQQHVQRQHDLQHLTKLCEVMEQVEHVKVAEENNDDALSTKIGNIRLFFHPAVTSFNDKSLTIICQEMILPATITTINRMIKERALEEYNGKSWKDSQNIPQNIQDSKEQIQICNNLCKIIQKYQEVIEHLPNKKDTNTPPQVLEEICKWLTDIVKNGVVETSEGQEYFDPEQFFKPLEGNIQFYKMWTQQNEKKTEHKKSCH